jgi:hypothetical protein
MYFAALNHLRQVHSGTKFVAGFPNLEFESDSLLRNRNKRQYDFFFRSLTFVRLCNLRSYTYEWF